MDLRVDFVRTVLPVRVAEFVIGTGGVSHTVVVVVLGVLFTVVGYSTALKLNCESELNVLGQ